MTDISCFPRLYVDLCTRSQPRTPAPSPNLSVHRSPTHSANKLRGVLRRAICFVVARSETRRVCRVSLPCRFNHSARWISWYDGIEIELGLCVCYRLIFALVIESELTCWPTEVGAATTAMRGQDIHSTLRFGNSIL